MHVLIKESPLQMLPLLVMQVGLYEAILFQQLSANVRDGISGFTKHMTSGKTKNSHLGLSIYEQKSDSETRRERLYHFDRIVQLDENGQDEMHFQTSRTKTPSLTPFKICDNRRRLHQGGIELHSSLFSGRLLRSFNNDKKLQFPTVQHAPSTTAQLAQEEVQCGSSTYLAFRQD